MKFNKAVLAIFMLMLFISACSTHSKKAAVADPAVDDHAIAPGSILPAGPVTPNPYLQNKPALNAATEEKFHVALVAMQQKNWSQAEILLQSLAKENPAYSGIDLNLGIVYRAKGDNAKAEDAFAQAIKVNPKNIDAYNQLAILKREAGKFSEAEALYQKALAVWPFHADSHKNIAILYELYMGKPEQALPHYLAYQQLLPAPDKQVDSWIADLQHRLNGSKKVPADTEKNDPAVEVK